MRKRAITLAVAIPIVLLLAAFVYNLPPIHDRLAWRVDLLRSEIIYALNPPEQVVFVPQGEPPGTSALAVASRQPTTTSTPLPSVTPTSPGPTNTPAPSPTPTHTPEPLPSKATLTGIQHEFQKWNNCGPANLAMALSFWDWPRRPLETNELLQTAPAAYMKPNPRDKNVMPYEMVAYVNEQTDLRALTRVGGELELLKAFISAGFPVIVEKGFEGANFDGWMGHYEVLNEFDDAKERFTAQDSYIQANLPVPYSVLVSYWRAFNYTYIVIFPPERENEVLAILGPHSDETFNYRHAAQIASDEIFQTENRDQFFAWYNRGSSLVALQDYAGAAEAYDRAFAIYPTIPEKERPWRMVWYQTGPYFAYFYSGRYYDVLNLATTTIDTANEPAIEESFYWRAMARAALGDTDGAIADFRTSLDWHPDFGPTLYQLSLLGVSP